MPRYTIDTFTPQIPYREAKRALEVLDDSALVQRITSEMMSLLPALAWDADEPEHEGLARTLRLQAQADLKTLYMGTTDAWCDNHLGIGWDPTTGSPVLSVVSDGETDGDDGDYLINNPVVRLRALRICDRPDPVQRIEDAVLRASSHDWAAHHVIRPLTISANQVYLIDDPIPPRPDIRADDSEVF